MKICKFCNGKMNFLKVWTCEKCAAEHYIIAGAWYNPNKGSENEEVKKWY